MIALSLTPTETLRVFSPFEESQTMPEEYQHGADLSCPQDTDGVTWFEIRALTQSERRAASAMAPDLPDGEDDSDRAQTAWILELQKCYLAFGLVNVEHDEWKAEKSARFLGQKHYPLESIDAIPSDTQVWLANAVYQLSHPK
jgi:hypothetical protein